MKKEGKPNRYKRAEMEKKTMKALKVKKREGGPTAMVIINPDKSGDGKMKGDRGY